MITFLTGCSCSCSLFLRAGGCAQDSQLVSTLEAPSSYVLLWSWPVSGHCAASLHRLAFTWMFKGLFHWHRFRLNLNALFLARAIILGFELCGCASAFGASGFPQCVKPRWKHSKRAARSWKCQRITFEYRMRWSNTRKNCFVPLSFRL